MNKAVTYLDRSNVWFSVSIRHTASPWAINQLDSAPSQLPPGKECTAAVLWPSCIHASPKQGFGGFIMAAVNMDRGGKHSTFLQDLIKSRDHQGCKDALWTVLCNPHKEIHNLKCYWGWCPISMSISTHPSRKHFSNLSCCLSPDDLVLFWLPKIVQMNSILRAASFASLAMKGPYLSLSLAVGAVDISSSFQFCLCLFICLMCFHLW